MKLALGLLLVAGLWAVSAQAQPPVIRAIELPPDPDAIALYEGDAPGSESARQVEGWLEFAGQRMLRNVTRPTLTPVLPAAGKATGAAVIIAPGGAYLMLSMENEGHAVARWLADRGVAAFLLKYRLDETPVEPAEFLREMGRRFAGARSNPPLRQPLADADALAALRMVRARSADWGVDPRRVGFLGFSAGAITALQAALAADPTTRPDFVAPIYGPLEAVAVPKDAPPMFLAMAADDPLFSRRGFALAEVWNQARRPLELHVYERGGHGFGMKQQGTTSDGWAEDFLRWMDARGLLRPAT
jgi:acetyl esterase/lipase